MGEITKAEMKRLVRRDLIRWPPFSYDGFAYAWSVETEGNPAELVWAPV